MPLSDHEQRLLDEIEQALYAEDPKFASHVRSARARSRTGRDAVLCVAVGVLGLGLVLVGLVTTIIALSVVGFVLFVGGCGWGTQLIVNRKRGSAKPAAATPIRPARPSGLRNRMEDRLRRRFDEE